jgi:hypothetical protein
VSWFSSPHKAFAVVSEGSLAISSGSSQPPRGSVARILASEHDDQQVIVFPAIEHLQMKGRRMSNRPLTD